MTPHRLIAIVLLLLAAQLARGGSTLARDAASPARDGHLTSPGVGGRAYALSLPEFSIDHPMRRAGAGVETGAGLPLGEFASSELTAVAPQGVSLREGDSSSLLGIPPLTAGPTVLAGVTGPGLPGSGNQWGLEAGLRESFRIRTLVPPPAVPSPASSALATLFLLGLACARLPR